MIRNDNPNCRHPDDCRRCQTSRGLYCRDCREHAAGHIKWTDGLIAYLKQLNSGGMPTSAIAAAIGDYFGIKCTRNMIIGKMRRLGISTGNPIGPRKERPRNGKLRRRLPRQPVEKTMGSAPEIAEPIPDIIRWDGLAKIKFLDRRPNQCAWVVGEPKGVETMCCGDPAVHSWCDYHYEIVHERSAARRSLIEVVHDEMTIASMKFAREQSTGKSVRWRRQLGSLRSVANRSIYSKGSREIPLKTPPSLSSPAAGGDRGLAAASPDPPRPVTPDGAGE